MEEKPQPSCSSSDRPKRRKTPNSKYFGDDMVSSQKQSRKTDTEKTEVNETCQITQSSDENQSNESAEASVLQKGNKLASSSSDIQKTRQITESSDENESIVFVGDSNVKRGLKRDASFNESDKSDENNDQPEPSISKDLNSIRSKRTKIPNRKIYRDDMITEKTQSIQTGSQENDEDFDFNSDGSDIENSDSENSDEIPPALVCLTLHWVFLNIFFLMADSDGCKVH